MKILIGFILGVLLASAGWASLIYFTNVFDKTVPAVNSGAQLVGKKWYLQGVDYSKANIFISFDSATKLTGFAGCNNFFADYMVEGISIAVTDIGSTKVFCEQTSDTETQFLDNLTSVDRFTIDGSKLVLKGGEDELVLELAK